MFGRRSRSPSAARSRSAGEVDPPDSDLPGLTTAEASRLIELVLAEFRRQGYDVSYAIGMVLTGQHSFSLANLAASAAHARQRHWDSMVRRQVSHLLAAALAPLPPSLEEARGALTVRVHPVQRFPLGAPPHARPFADGLVVLPAVRGHSHVVDLVDEGLLARYGGADAVWTSALGNLGGLAGGEQTEIRTDRDRDDASVFLLHYDDLCASARLLRLQDEVARLPTVRAPLGCFVAAPSRHRLALHVIRGEGIVTALPRMVSLRATTPSGPGWPRSPIASSTGRCRVSTPP